MRLIVLVGFLIYTSLPAQQVMVRSVVGDDTFNVLLPQFPGGKDAMYEYFNNEINFDSIAGNSSIHDTITAGFYINAYGDMEGFTVTSKHKSNAVLDSTVLHAIKSSPLWVPGTINGIQQSGAVTMILYINVVGNSGVEFMLDSTKTRFFYECMPVYPGGEGSFQTFLAENIKYPAQEKKKRIEGVVYVYFEVAKDGSVGNARVTKGVPGGAGLSEEALRVVRAMPDWTPGTMNGRTVKVGMTVPIRFTLAGSRKK